MTKRSLTVIMLLLISILTINAQDEVIKKKAPLKIEPSNFLRFQTELGTDAPNTGANYVAVDTMSNTFGPASGTLNPVAFDPISSVLAVIHRGNANTYALGSGELWWNTSQDIGMSWVRSQTSVQNGITNTILARYPSMTIFNPSGSSNFADILGAFSWPELNDNPVEFRYLGLGVTLGMEISAFAEINFDAPQKGSNVPTFTDDVYVYWVTDNAENNSLQLFRTQDFAVVEEINPPTWNDTMFVNGNIAMGGVAYNGVLYYGLTASFLPEIGLGGWEVGYSKSTDNGSTWSDWFIPDWHLISGFEQYEELWDWLKGDGFISYAGDIQVDKDGLVHMIAGLTDLADSSDDQGDNIIVEFFETSEGVWDIKIVAPQSEVHDTSFYTTPGDQDPSVGQNGPSFMIATNWDRDFFTVTYDIGSPETGDTLCDIYARTRALTDADWSKRTNLTETNTMNENGSHLAPYLATVNDGTNITDFAFSMFWYEAGNTDYLINNVNPSVVYIAPIMVRQTPIVSVEDDATNPLSYALEQNYPNPFNPSTSIKYSLAERSVVSLKVYDILGNEVATLVNTTQDVGSYDINFDAANLASGLYVYTLKAGSFTSTKKMMLLK